MTVTSHYDINETFKIFHTSFHNSFFTVNIHPMSVVKQICGRSPVHIQSVVVTRIIMKNDSQGIQTRVREKSVRP